jgi:hypothetical protein
MAALLVATDVMTVDDPASIIASLDTVYKAAFSWGQGKSCGKSQKASYKKSREHGEKKPLTHIQRPFLW